MKIYAPVVAILILLASMANTTLLHPSAAPAPEALNTSVDQLLFDNAVWWIQKGTGPAIQSPMEVFVNGVDMGTTYLLEIGHLKVNDWPQIAALYNTGYVRLTPPGLPFGTSFILGPGYWGNDGIYVHNIQISRIDIDTSGADPFGPIQLTIHARDYSVSRWPDYHMDITYDATLYDPAVDATQMMVTESFSVAKAFSLSTSRQASHEGFKWVQFSSMYIDNHYHDSDSAVYVDADEIIHFSKFSEVGCNQLIFKSPETLSSLNPWVEAIHWDNVSWQGNTPNTIIEVKSPGIVGQTSSQGYITCTTDPNDDNVSIWLNHDSAPLSFNVGNTGSITYTLVSQDNPKVPPLTFRDVPLTHVFWKYIEAFYRAGITTGCSQTPKKFCPLANVTRGEMAVFIERALGNFNPTPDPTDMFDDVPYPGQPASFQPFIEEFYNDGITTGCSTDPLKYCPQNYVTRGEMAVFIERALGNFNPTPNPTGMFDDVPYPGQPSTFTPFIEQFYNDGITTGCSPDPLKYCPQNKVTRQEMAVFIVRAFGIPLP